MEAIRISVLAAASSMLLVMMMMIIIISSASVELTEEAPSPSPSSSTTTDAAASATLNRSGYLFTMEFCIGDTRVSAIADTGSGLIWTTKSQWLLDDSVMSCGGITSPSCGGLCTFERKYNSGKVRGVKGKGKLTFGGGCGSAATPAPASSGIVVNYDSSNPITIGSAIMFDDDCHQQQQGHLSSSSDDDVLLLTGDENEAACGAYAAGGIVGLNRDPLSLVTQLRLHSFSYCLPHYSHGTSTTGEIKFNDATPISSFGTSTTTNLLVDSDTYPTLTRHYVVKVKKIRIGKTSLKDVQAAEDDCSLNKDQPAGAAMIIDSGTFLTRLPENYFDDLNENVKKLLVEKKKEKDEELKEHKKEGFSCYQGTYPEGMDSIVLDFCSGGGGMEIPPENYFIQKEEKTTDGGGKDSYFCFAFIKHNKESSLSRYILLGAYQQQDMHMLFDNIKQDNGGTLSIAKRSACGGQPPAQDQENHATM